MKGLKFARVSVVCGSVGLCLVLAIVWPLFVGSGLKTLAVGALFVFVPSIILALCALGEGMAAVREKARLGYLGIALSVGTFLAVAAPALVAR